MVRLVCRVTLRDSVCARTTLTERRATNAKKDSTIFLLARNVTVIPLVLQRISQDVDHCRPVNCVSARTGYKEEFATSVVLSTGT
jgi:hypothetical protein